MTGFESDFDTVDDTPTIEDLWAAMEELSSRIDALIEEMAASAFGQLRDAANRFESVEDWVEQWWAVHLARDVASSQFHWCEQWLDHPEGLSRLTGLWERWEQLQIEPAGMVAWWREADTQIQVLMGSAGPFRQCKTGDQVRHRRFAPLSVAATSATAHEEIEAASLHDG